eukprot:m.50421 g.50421  ORF g.50421 m.50421 type:complete len:523 (+) comp11160_c1_seq2:163-1731(+)
MADGSARLVCSGCHKDVNTKGTRPAIRTCCNELQELLCETCLEDRQVRRLGCACSDFGVQQCKILGEVVKKHNRLVDGQGKMQKKLDAATKQAQQHTSIVKLAQFLWSHKKSRDCFSCKRPAVMRLCLRGQLEAVPCCVSCFTVHKTRVVTFDELETQTHEARKGSARSFSQSIKYDGVALKTALRSDVDMLKGAMDEAVETFVQSQVKRLQNDHGLLVAYQRARQLEDSAPNLKEELQKAVHGYCELFPEPADTKTKEWVQMVDQRRAMFGKVMAARRVLQQHYEAHAQRVSTSEIATLVPPVPIHAIAPRVSGKKKDFSMLLPSTPRRFEFEVDDVVQVNDPTTAVDTLGLSGSPQLTTGSGWVLDVQGDDSLETTAAQLSQPLGIANSRTAAPPAISSSASSSSSSSSASDDSSSQEVSPPPTRTLRSRAKRSTTTRDTHGSKSSEDTQDSDVGDGDNTELHGSSDSTNEEGDSRYSAKKPRRKRSKTSRKPTTSRTSEERAEPTPAEEAGIPFSDDDF